MDVLEPVTTLGGYLPASTTTTDTETTSNRKQKKGKKDKKKPRSKPTLPPLKPDSHSDAILCLAWHEAHRERLASGSADETVKLWDITTQQCIRTLTHHSTSQANSTSKEKKKNKKKTNETIEEEDDESWYTGGESSHKIQSIDWNPTEPSILLTGAYDKTIHMVDVRAPSGVNMMNNVFNVDADVEVVKWHPHPTSLSLPLFMAAVESGLIYAFDARNNKSPVFRLNAHTGACTTISFNPSVPTLFFTAGQDKQVKVWSLTPSDTTITKSPSPPSSPSYQPSLLMTRDLQIGNVWSGAWEREGKTLLACGGDKGKIAVWDVRESKEIMNKYGKELAE